ncbi:phage portal protein [Telmatocola sphagniphila]|uniref:Phage portal protein n=1 Tax=Telmatocola sphagniphila TaxID=1123043 RepID=A0A8E6B392_9BACT|nr:phage portal protein [Telmatocola sphagniphila]QVL30931.1 phage portal protein [Telmatocola sphagniphila]
MAFSWLRKALGPKASRLRIGSLWSTPTPNAGWWRDDPTEQLRQYQSWVYAAVNAIAQEIGRQRPYCYRNWGQAEHEQTPLVANHPLVQLLEHPNPKMTPWELWYLTVLYLELTGNCYWHVASRGDGLPGELWIIPTHWIRIVTHTSVYAYAYELRVPGAPAEYFSPEEIIHLKYPNPLDVYYGLSPLQANALTIDANAELQRSRWQTFQAGQRPGMVLQTDQTLNDATVVRLEEKLQSKFSGRENWQRPLVLEQGLKASPWTFTPAEMDYLNSCRLTRDEIFALFRVPPPVAGMIETVGLGADIWHGARTIFCEGTIQPKLDLIAQALTRDLARRFDADLVIAFPDCSPRNQDQRRLDDELDARLGLRTVNEIRRARGLKPFSDGKFDQPRCLGHVAERPSLGN